MDLLAMRWKVQQISGLVRDMRSALKGLECNNVFGCLEEERFERCTCYRDCGYDGDPVCGSDGQLYQNQCQMEVFACRNGKRYDLLPHMAFWPCFGPCYFWIDRI
uniref:Kazal-like domain-containing protein n=1 Tax=Amphilophus citrinellus TaxID=61819 RepID=A0A3Q0S5H4_AMPCI